MLRIPEVTTPIRRAFLMNSPSESLTYEVKDGHIHVTVPSGAPDVAVPVVCVEASGAPEAP